MNPTGKGRLIQTPFYRGRDFAVALWEGDAGDALRVVVSEPTPRSAFACLTIVLRGKFQMISPSGDEKWRFFPGSTSDDGGDFDEIGVWAWTALHNNAQELCFSALDEHGKECDDSFPREKIFLQFGEKAKIESDSLMVLATGGIVVNVNGEDRSLIAPHFSKIENNIEVTANYSDTELLVVRRK